MTAQEVAKHISEKLAPQLDELGVEGFVMCAYISDSEGKVSRVTLGGSAKNTNPAYWDGLRVMEGLAAAWGAGTL